jgi:small GTP-binding protein
MELLPLLPTALSLFSGIFGKKKHTTEVRYVENPETKRLLLELEQKYQNGQITIEKLNEENNKIKELIKNNELKFTKEIEQYQIKIKDTEEKMNELMEEMKKNEINTFDDLKNHDEKVFNRIIQLCLDLPPIPIQGINIGYFGLTGVGKSSLINACIGEDVCKVGETETTKVEKPYRKINSKITYWDLPGQTDEINYMNTTFIGLLKSLKFVGVVITRSYTQSSSLMRLLQKIGVKYHVIVNQVDKSNDLNVFKEKLKENFVILNEKYLKEKKEVLKFENNSTPLFVSTKNVNKFDFDKLINLITNFD